MTFPVRHVVLPAALLGQRNGRLDPRILTTIPGQAGGPDITMVTVAARAMRAMIAAARRDGHILKSVSSYRTYERQVELFKARYTTSRIVGARDIKEWNGATWYLKPGMAVAAAPGTSNHGLGLADDLGEERDSDLTPESLDDATLKWLIANEGSFGFSHEIQSEPWHVHYWAGDLVPRAVLEYERNHNQPGDDDVTPAEMLKILEPVNQKLDALKKDVDSLQTVIGTRADDERIGTVESRLSEIVADTRDMQGKLDALLAK